MKKQLSELLCRLFSGDPLSRGERRLITALSPAAFAYVYLRTDDGTRLIPAPVHWQWYDLVDELLAGSRRLVCVMAPKNHGKSTLFGKVVPLYLTSLDRDMRAIYASINAETSERFYRGIRRELERNELLIEDWGPFRPRLVEKWTQTELIVERKTTSVSPTWRAVSTGKPVQGGRADWLFADDVVSDENSATGLQRDKTQRWLESDLLGTLEPGGRAIAIGTAKHNDDFYHRIERSAKTSSDCAWSFRRYDAIEDEEQRRVLWPARWPYEALMARKAAIGTLAFARDYCNVAVSDETALFPRALLERAKRSDLSLQSSYDGPDDVTAGIDYAIIENEREAQLRDGDFTVCQVWQIRADKKRRLLDSVRRRGLGMTDQMQLIASTLRRYPTLRVAVSEANQAQRWMSSELLRRSRGELPIVPHVTSRKAHADVYEGVPGLRALFEADMIELPYADERSRAVTDSFCGELYGLGVEAHDDQVMAFYLNEVAVRKLGGGLSWGKLPTLKD